MTNKEKHTDVIFPCIQDVPKCISDRKFRKLNEVSDEIVEIEMAKETIWLDLPIQIGFFVYAYAKLRMLEFYYDFLDYYLDRKDFEYCEMDTDSAYIALAGKSIEQLILKDKIEEFYKNRHKWLQSVYCESHRDEFKETDMLSPPTMLSFTV